VNVKLSKIVIRNQRSVMRLLVVFLFFSNLLFSQINGEKSSGIYVVELTSYSLKIAVSSTIKGEMYLLVLSTIPFKLGVPKDGVKYMRGDQIGEGKVVSVGADTLFSVRGIRANTMYYLKLYAVEIKNNVFVYSQVPPIEFQVSTPGLRMENYYESISMGAPNFLTMLSELLQVHKVIPYSNYKTTVLKEVEFRDTVGGKTFVECAYSGEKKVFQEPFDWNATGYSREHTFAHSWMPTHPADNPPLPEYSDLHNLYPANLDKANTVRNNFPLGEVTGDVLYSYLEGRLGYHGNQIVYEPRAKHKGNAARSMMYMALAYNGISGNHWVFPKNQDQDVLKKWHFEDPPDNYEIARQEYIFAVQGNRNPFIDHPEYVCGIDFITMIKSKKVCYLETEETEVLPFRLVQSEEKIQFVSNENIDDLMLIDFAGKEIIHFAPRDTVFEMNCSLVQPGFYFVILSIRGKYFYHRIVR
jgi:hypothetical protein